MKITRIDKSQNAMDLHEAKGDEEAFYIARTVYSKMSSLTDNKVLVEPTDDDTKFNRFLRDMELIHQGIQTPLEVTLMDVYLGNLGETVEYPFRDDTYNIDPWITFSSQELYRNVAEGNLQDGTLFNIIDRDTVLNVIHDTGSQAQITGVLHGRA